MFVLSSTHIFSMIPKCMGRPEVFFPYDYFYDGGYSAVNHNCNYNNMYYFVPCVIMKIFNGLIWSNIIDFYLIIRIHYVLRYQRDSVENILLPRTLMQRKR